MRILIADKFSSAGQAALRSLGHEVEFRPTMSADELPAALQELQPGILVVRSTKVSEAALRAGGPLALVIRAGAGVNTIDLETASRCGVFVANCPGKNAIAVAELAVGLMLAIDRRIPDAVADMRTGRWEKKKYQKGKGVHGKSIGLVGFGNIAREVATRCSALGMRVLAWTPTLDDARCEPYGVLRCPGLDDLLAMSDVLSVHVPYRESTRHLIGARELALLPDGATVLHTARGGVIDDKALMAEVESGRLFAGLDVLEAEPSGGSAAVDNPLAALEGAYVTPHIGASTSQAAEAIASEVVRIVRGFTDLGVVHNAVNVQKTGGARFSLVVRHLDRVGVLAGVLDALRRERLNVKNMQNVIFEGNEAASATISLEREPSGDLLDAIRGTENVLAVDLRSAPE